MWARRHACGFHDQGFSTSPGCRGSTDGDPDAAGSRRDSDAAADTEQVEEEREMGHVDRGLGGVDGAGGVDTVQGEERAEWVGRARVTANEYEIKGEPELRVLNLGEDEGQLRGRY